MQEFIESRVEMEDILKEEAFGYLGLCAEEGQPYVVPINYCYSDGRILIHCALAGRKLDCIRANPSVCFTVARQFGKVMPHAEGDPCHLDCDSVICCGTARVVEDAEERLALLKAFAGHFTQHRPNRKVRLEQARKCSAIEIDVKAMTGRRERECKVTCWKHTFSS